MTTIQFIIEAIDKASRKINDVANAAERLERDFKDLSDTSKKLDANLAGTGAAAKRASDALDSFTRSVEMADKAAKDGIKIPITVDEKNLQAALRKIRTEANAYFKAHPITAPVIFDLEDLPGAIRRIKAAMQREHLADFLDIDMNLGQIDSQLRILKRKFNQFGVSDLLNFNINIANVDAQLDMLKKKIGKSGIADVLGVNLNLSQLDDQLARLRKQIEKAGITDVLGINVDPKSLARALATVKAYFRSNPVNIPVAFDVSAAAVTRAIVAARAVIRNNPITIPVAFDTSTAAVMRAIVAARAAFRNNPITVPISLSVSQAEMLKIAQTIRAWFRLNPITVPVQIGTFGAFGTAGAAAALARLTKALNTNGQAAQQAGFGWGFLNTRVQLFGGLLGPRNTFMGGVNAWELAFHILLDTTILLVATMAALAPTLAAMFKPAEGLADRLGAIYQVTTALNAKIPPLTGQFTKLINAMAPRVIELYGGALDILNRNSGVLGSTVQDLSKLFDTWIAKIDLWSNKQNTLSGILHAGAGYVHQLGTFIGELFIAINNLLKDSPDTIHFLLDFFNGAAKVLDILTSLPHGLGVAILAFLSFRTYGGLAVTALKNVGLALLGLGKSIAQTGILGSKLYTLAGGAQAAQKSFLGLSLVSWGWIAVVAAGLAYLGYQLFQADKGTQDFINAMNTNIQALPVSQAIPGISVAIGQLNTKIKDIQTSFAPALTSMVTGAQQAQSHFGQFFGDLKNGVLSVDTLKNAFDGVTSSLKSWLGFQGQIGQSFQNRQNIEAYQAEISKLLGQYGNMLGAIGQIMNRQTSLQISYSNTGKATTGVASQTERTATNMERYGGTLKKVTTQSFDYQQALGLMDLAGVQAGDSMAVMVQKVNNLITGYKNMGEQGGLLTNAVNAVTLQIEQQDSKISSLTGAWSNFISLVTGSETAFVTFAQGMATLASNSQAAGASMDGLNANSLTLRSTWEQQITQAQTLYNALADQASVLGNGAEATAALSKAGKDLVLELLPFAKGSQQATAQVFALAQVAGYKGATGSFQQLAKWAGNTKNPMADLNTETGKLSVSASNLQKDVQALATSVQQTLTQAMSQAIFLASGGQKAFNTFADAIMNGNGSMKQLQAAAKPLAEQLLRTTGNAQQAHQEFNTFATKLGLSTSAANDLWNSIVNGAQKMANSHNARLGLINDIQAILDRAPGAKTDMQNLATAVQKHGATAQSYAPQRAKLIADLEASGLNAQTATSLTDAFIRKLGQIPASKTVQLIEDGTASFKITQIGQIATLPSPGGGILPTPSGHQAGGMITGGTAGRDSVPALLMPGEVVVPTAMVNAGAVDHLRGALPGFQAGGIVPGGPMIPEWSKAQELRAWAPGRAPWELGKLFYAGHWWSGVPDPFGYPVVPSGPPPGASPFGKKPVVPSGPPPGTSPFMPRWTIEQEKRSWGWDRVSHGLPPLRAPWELGSLYWKGHWYNDVPKPPGYPGNFNPGGPMVPFTPVNPGGPAGHFQAGGIVPGAPFEPAWTLQQEIAAWSANRAPWELGSLYVNGHWWSDVPRPDFNPGGPAGNIGGRTHPVFPTGPPPGTSPFGHRPVVPSGPPPGTNPLVPRWTVEQERRAWAWDRVSRGLKPNRAPWEMGSLFYHGRWYSGVPKPPGYPGNFNPGGPMIPFTGRKRGSVPVGFAAGGLVTELGNTAVINGDESATMYDTFYQDMTLATERAMTAGMKQAAAAILPPPGSVGGGVLRWASTALQAMGMLGIPAGDLGIVLSQMTTESGGNPYAVNLTDSNAAAGMPSTGLMQVIAPTYARWGAPWFGYPSPVANMVSEEPLANIFAGLNYAIHTYPDWTAVLGHGHGYAEGGMVSMTDTAMKPFGMTSLPVQLFDSGGYLQPGMTLALNNTGRPEPVGGGGDGTDMSTVEGLLGMMVRQLADIAAASSPDSHARALSQQFSAAAHTAATAGMTSTRAVPAW